MNKLAWLKWVMGGVVVVGAVVVLLFIYNGGAPMPYHDFVQSGASMEPTIHDSQKLRVGYGASVLSSIKRGDIVLFKYPKNLAYEFVKRVVGLPGERVEVRKDGGVYINGARIVEPYITGDTPALSDRTMGSDEYFVMGDNRHNSSDSRSWGPLKLELITGVVQTNF
jgi:signal peptidase I